MLKSCQGPYSPCGESEYVEEDPENESRQTSIHVKIYLKGKVEIQTFARLDPATHWVIIQSEFNKQLDIQHNNETIYLETLAGRMTGRLARYPISLLADTGNSMEIDSTLFVCDDWNRGNFLGYSGFLQIIRFGVNPEKRLFIFGALQKLR